MEREFCSKKTKKKLYDAFRYLSNPNYYLNKANDWKENNSNRVKENKHNWYLDNKPELNAKNLKYYYDHHEESKKHNLDNYYKNREARIQQVLKYARDNPDKVNARNRNWRRKNPEKYLEYQKKSLMKLAKELSMTYTNYRRALQAWSLAVKTRDNFTCQWCGSKYDHEAHHILWKSLFPFESLEVSNGITLCESCHDEVERLQE